MLAINPQSSKRKLTPNLLPCTIKHSGPIKISKRYWSPSSSTTHNDSTSTAYFRGRKLRGRTVKVPEGYQGLVLQKTEKPLPKRAPTVEELRRLEGEDEGFDGMIDAEDVLEVRGLEQVARFGEMVIWGHEAVPEGDDIYVRGVEEWMAFAQAVCEHISQMRQGTMTDIGVQIHSYDDSAST